MRDELAELAAEPGLARVADFTGGEGILGQSGDSKAAAEKYSESLRQKLFPYLA